MEQENKDKRVQDLEQIKQMVSENSIHISGAGRKTKTRFKKLASSTFHGDYGHTLTYLLDFRDALINTPQAELWETVDVISKRLLDIERELASLRGQEEQKPVRRNLLGKPIGEGGERNGKQ